MGRANVQPINQFWSNWAKSIKRIIIIVILGPVKYGCKFSFWKFIIENLPFFVVRFFRHFAISFYHQVFWDGDCQHLSRLHGMRAMLRISHMGVSTCLLILWRKKTWMNFNTFSQNLYKKLLLYQLERKISKFAIANNLGVGG